MASEESITLQIFVGAGPHAGDNGGRTVHLADSEQCQVIGGGVNNLQGIECAMFGLRVNIHQHDFRVHILDLPQDRVAGAGREIRSG